MSTSRTIGAGSGIVTDVTATTPLASSGGTTPDISHAVSGVGAGTYTSVTVDLKGHVTAGTNPAVVTFDPVTNPYMAAVA